MDERGTLAGFIVSKTGAALAALAMMGLGLAMFEGAGRAAEVEELELVVESVERAFLTIDGIPGNARFTFRLPEVGQHFVIVISGELAGDMQVVKVEAMGRGRAERVFLLANEFGGELRAESPREIRLEKADGIRAELM